MSEDNPLPDRLKSGQILRTKSGGLVRVGCTNKKDKEGEPYYRLTHIGSNVKSSQLWTRDYLNELGVEEHEPT